MTWRQRIALFKFYSDNGRNTLQWVYQLAGAGAFARLLLPTWVPTWWIVAAGPFVLLALAFVGYAHKRWGWMVEESAVAVTEEVSRPNEIILEWLARLLEERRLSLNGSTRLRAEVREALRRRD